MLHQPPSKATEAYYCRVGILLASVAIMLVEICAAKGILNTKQDKVHNTEVLVVPRG